MLGDVRVLDVDELPGAPVPDAPTPALLLDTERVALQTLFDLIRRFSLGHDVTLHKRTLETAQLSLIGPEARADRRRRGAARQEHAQRARRGSAAARRWSPRPTSGIDVIADSERPRRRRRRC